MICLQGLHFDSPNLQDSFNLALFCGIHEKYAMWKFIVDVVNDFVSSLQPDVGRGFLHVSNVFLFILKWPLTFQTNRYALSSRLSKACQAYKSICLTLLSVYESLQTSYEALLAKLPPNEQIKIGKNGVLMAH